MEVAPKLNGDVMSADQKWNLCVRKVVITTEIFAVENGNSALNYRKKNLDVVKNPWKSFTEDKFEEIKKPRRKARMLSSLQLQRNRVNLMVVLSWRNKFVCSLNC